MFQTFNFFKFEQLKFEQLISFLYEIVNCSNCYCSTFRADNNIIDICSNLVNPFGKVDSSSFINLFICSNGVEQSRFWCRAVFSSRWILSRWPISVIFTWWLPAVQRILQFLLRTSCSDSENVFDNFPDFRSTFVSVVLSAIRKRCRQVPTVRKTKL